LENFCTPASRCMPVFQKDLLPPLTGYMKVFTLMMETAGNCETLVYAYQAALCYPKRWLVSVHRLKFTIIDFCVRFNCFF